MNTKVLYSIGVIVLVAGIAIAGTYAFFTADRTTSSNQFSVGTLDLDVSSNGNASEPFIVENLGTLSEISGKKTWKIKNTGTLPGRLYLNLQNVKNLENGCNDQEKVADPTCETSGKEGNLGEHVNLKIFLGTEEKVSSTLATSQEGKISADWSELSMIVLQPSEEREVSAFWFAGSESYGNEIQSDSTSFSLNFRLTQLTTTEAGALR